MKRAFILVISLLLIPVIGFSKTIHVPADHSTIQAAIDSSVDGDTVLVSPGTYYEMITFRGKAITVKSSDGAAVTYIWGKGSTVGDTVTLNSGEWRDSVLDGFTITNGKSGVNASSAATIINNVITGNSRKYGAGISVSGDALIQGNEIVGNATKPLGSGGGILVGALSRPLIIDNTIANNSADGSGGIQCGADSVVLILNNRIYKNSATNGNGGGITFGHCNIDIIGNLICENTTTEDGGGIYSSGFTNLIIRGNTITQNTADQGGGIYARSYSTLVEVSNNVIYGNTATTNGGGIRCEGASFLDLTNNTIVGNSAGSQGGGISMDKCIMMARNTICWNNSAPNGKEFSVTGFGSTLKSFLDINYSDVEGGQSSVFLQAGCKLVWGNNMMDTDPLFVDSANGDLHISYLSPCRDVGDNSAAKNLIEDFEGNPRIAYGTVDMGADEFYTHLYWTGDATPGGNVEIKFVGLPGTSPVGLCLGTGVLDPPVPSMWGDWYLMFPVVGPLMLAQIPSNGVEVLSGVLPGTPPAPYSIPMQALIGAELTNLCIINVE